MIALIVGLGLVVALGASATALGSTRWMARTHIIRAQWDPYFYYDPYDPCLYTSCDQSYYSPSQDYYFDPGTSCDASICDAGYIDPVGDFYYDPGSSTDSSLIDTSSADWSAGGEGAADPTVVAKTQALRHVGASLAHAQRRTAPRATSSGAPAYTFVDNARSYRLVYPSYWRRFNRPGLDFLAFDSDGNAGVDAVAQSGPPVSFNQGLQQYFANLGGTPVRVEEQSVSYLGDTIDSAEVEFYWNSTGVYGGTVVVMIQDHGRAYYLAGVVANINAPSVQQDALHVSSIISSLNVLHIVVVPPRLAARFTDKTHTYRFTYAKDWKRQRRRGTVDFTLRSPDNQAVLVSLSRAAPKHAKSVTARDMHALVSILGRQVGKVTGKPIYHSVRYKRVLRRIVTFTYQARNGQKGTILIVAALHHHRVCVVGGVVLNSSAATTNRDGARVSAMISSLGFV
ncbi:MAG TPA: hypothetical protein VGY32_02810 [Solirubrobacteraceae bacterium]|nr:hypothetical protein [Solirubrobacteraceae bacterium]